MANESEIINPNPSPDEKSTPPPPPSASSMGISLSIWPPSQRTRDAVTGRLVEMLSNSSSPLASRYGTVPSDAAAEIAAAIEAAAFSTASASAGEEHASSVEAGLEILEKYSKEISSRMLDSVRGKNPKLIADPNLSPDPAVAGGDGEEKVAADGTENEADA